MLPTLAPHPAHVSASATDRLRRVARCHDSPDPDLFQDHARSHIAARLCARCPAATDCLIQALRWDAAHRSGRDDWGIAGTFAGVWFTFDQPPRRIASAPHDDEEDLTVHHRRPHVAA